MGRIFCLFFFLVLSGALVGELIRSLPERFFPSEWPRLTRPELVQTFPQKRWIIFIFPIAHVLSHFLALFLFWLLFVAKGEANPFLVLFLCPITIFVGSEVPTGLMELVAGVHGSYERHNHRFLYIVHPMLPWYGAISLFLYLLVMLLAWVSLVFLHFE